MHSTIQEKEKKWCGNHNSFQKIYISICLAVRAWAIHRQTTWATPKWGREREKKRKHSISSYYLSSLLSLKKIMSIVKMRYTFFTTCIIGGNRVRYRNCRHGCNISIEFLSFVLLSTLVKNHLDSYIYIRIRCLFVVVNIILYYCRRRKKRKWEEKKKKES